MECRSPSLSSKDAFKTIQEQNFCNRFTKTTPTELSLSTELFLSTPDTRSTSSKKASSVRVTESTTLDTTSSTTVSKSTRSGVGSVSTADYSSKSKNDNYQFDTGSPYKNDMRNGYLMLRL